LLQDSRCVHGSPRDLNRRRMTAHHAWGYYPNGRAAVGHIIVAAPGAPRCAFASAWRSDSKPGGIVAEAPRTTMPHRFPPASRNRSTGCSNCLAKRERRVLPRTLAGSRTQGFFHRPTAPGVDFLQHRSPLIRLHLSPYVVKLQRCCANPLDGAQRAPQRRIADRSARAMRGDAAGAAGA
jgi:hypothetical protein